MNSPILSITSATEDEKPIVARLLQLYLHDFSEFSEPDDQYGLTDGSGVFPYDHLDSYWHDAHREAVLFRTGANLAGFALINDWSPSGRRMDKAIAEFFILRKFRRTSLGTQAATQIFQRNPITWEVAIADYNLPALTFWQSVAATLDDYKTQEINGDGHRWRGKIMRLLPSS